LNDIFQANKGDHQVSFDVVEIEKVTKKTEVVPVKEIIPIENDSEIDVDDLDVASEMEVEEETILETVPNITEENRVVTRLSMPSRKLKIKISKELLEELERMQINFKLN